MPPNKTHSRNHKYSLLHQSVRQLLLWVVENDLVSTTMRRPTGGWTYERSDGGFGTGAESWHAVVVTQLGVGRHGVDTWAWVIVTFSVKI